MEKENKMAYTPMKKLFWQMGLPMIISMVLQALYNVVDSVFVTNMEGTGAIANQALTLAFPIQILMIAVGVGTGVGLNTLLSKYLGENEKEKASIAAGNGIFLSLCLFLIFLIFGLFGSEWFISLFAGGNEEVIEMGTTYLKICTIFSLGSLGYSVFERLLQSTGKTMLSTIAQISGAVTNIVLDYVFIFPLNGGVAGAAWATIIGQFVSLILAMIFHYTTNKEINGNPKFIKPNFSYIKDIYKIGISAALMQALLSVMMAGMNAILGLSSADQTILIGSFGIYYKVQQIALFSAFGLSNTIISILSFNYGMKDKKRVNECIKYGIIDTMIVSLIITVLFEIFASPISKLFGLAGGSTTEIIKVCTYALRIASIGYIFMGFSIAVQGILQSLGYAIRPLIIALFRLVIFVFPVAYLFTLSDSVTYIVWWTFPIAEVLTAIISIFILKDSYKKKVKTLVDEKVSENVIISISREHGTAAKEIARNVASTLSISFYDKEEIKNFALKHSLIGENTETSDLYNTYLSLDVNKEAMISQSKAIKMIANEENAVIVGRASDYILRNYPNLVRVFLYAPIEYKKEKVKEMYSDSEENALKHIKASEKARAKYYEVISNQVWGDKSNYDLYLDCSKGVDEVVKTICGYVRIKIKKYNEGDKKY